MEDKKENVHDENLQLKNIIILRFEAFHGKSLISMCLVSQKKATNYIMWI